MLNEIYFVYCKSEKLQNHKSYIYAALMGPNKMAKKKKMMM